MNRVLKFVNIASIIDIIIKLRQILKVLKIKKVYALMLHDCINLSYADIKNVKYFFQLAKKQKLSRFFGISIYSQNEFHRIYKYIKISLVQGPINFFDRTFIQNGFLQFLRKKKIKFYARSIFLQGTLLQNVEDLNSYFGPWKKQFQDFEDFCNFNKLTKIEACLSYVSQIKYIDYFVIGVLSVSEIKNILNTKLIKTIKFKNLTFSKRRKFLFHPINWKLK